MRLQVFFERVFMTQPAQLPENKLSQGISPITGDRFEEFLLLTFSQKKDTDLQPAWYKIQQQIKAFSANQSAIDLNQIFIDIMWLEALSYPIVEDLKRDITSEEWKNFEKQCHEIQERTKKVRMGFLHVQKQNPHSFEQLTPILNLLVKYNKELQSLWKDFKEEWRVYQNSPQPESGSDDDTTSESPPNENANATDLSENDEETNALVPPVFNRIQWHVYNVTIKVLAATLNHQWKTINAPESIKEEKVHPVVKLMVDEVRQIDQQTAEFEIIERVKIIRQRNAQLIHQLTPFYGNEPIIIKEVKEPSPSLKNEPSPVSQPIQARRKSFFTFAALKRVLLALIIILLLVIAGLVLNLWKPSSDHSEISERTLSFTPKGPTVSPAAKKKQNLIPESQLKKIMAGFKLNIPVYPASEELKQAANSPELKSQNALRKILENMGQETLIFQDAKKLYLVWKNKIQQFASLEEFQKYMQQLAEQYQQLLETVQVIQEELSQYDISISAGTVDGNPTYKMILKDKSGHTVTEIYLDSSIFRMQWEDSEQEQKALTPYDVVRKVQEQTHPQE